MRRVGGNPLNDEEVPDQGKQKQKPLRAQKRLAPGQPTERDRHAQHDTQRSPQAIGGRRLLEGDAADKDLRVRIGRHLAIA